MVSIGTTSVPAIVWGDTGPVIPSGPDLLAGIQADYNVAFNVVFNFNLNTPQGQLSSTLAAVLNNANQLLAYYVNQVDPAYSTGRMQDAIARLSFLDRQGAEPTVVSALCTGAVGTAIPLGSVAKSTDGNLYLCNEDGVIPGGGSVTLQFICQTTGPIPCPANALNTIYRNIPGWDTINNPADGVLGRNTETAREFEARRAASVAKNSMGPYLAVQGEVLAVAGVLDAYVTDNGLGTTAVIGGVSLVAHSIYVAAVGGTDADVAAAIIRKKSPGCNYNGNTTVVVTLTAGYSPPYPTYSVKFQRPAALAILFTVGIINSTQVPSDAQAQIAAALTAAFAGADGGPRARIGSTLLAARYVAPIVALGAWAQVFSVLLGSANSPDASFTASIAGTNMTVSVVGSGTLGVNQTLSGNGVAPGTRIVSQTSGPAGGTGVYVVTVTQTLLSGAMKSAHATLAQVAVNIDQVPTINSLDVIVSLV